MLQHGVPSPPLLAVLSVLAATSLAPASLKTGSFAPDALFLVPDRFAREAGKSVSLRCVSSRVSPLAAPRVSPLGKTASTDGPRRDTRPYERVKWFFVRHAVGQENRDAFGPVLDGRGSVAWRLSVPGTVVLGVDFRPDAILLPDSFVAALAARPGGASKHTPQRPLEGGGPDLHPQSSAVVRAVRVDHIQSAKLLVQVGPGGGNAEIATSKTGQAAEIRPLQDPTSLRAGSDLALCFYAEGVAVGGARVSVFDTATSQVQETTTNPSGSAHVRITRPGISRIVARTVMFSAAEGKTRYTLYTGTLTFEVPAPRPPGEGGTARRDPTQGVDR